VSLAASWPTEVQAIVLENTYTCIGDMVDKLMPVLSPFKNHLLKIKWDSDRKIRHLLQPILFVSGDSDELVPTEHMVRLHALATKSRLPVFYSVGGGTHNDTWERAGAMYYEVYTHIIHMFIYIY
jgi:abhydrolase domain-containing protein 13